MTQVLLDLFTRLGYTGQLLQKLIIVEEIPGSCRILGRFGPGLVEPSYGRRRTGAADPHAGRTNKPSCILSRSEAERAHEANIRLGAFVTDINHGASLGQHLTRQALPDTM